MPLGRSVPWTKFTPRSVAIDVALCVFMSAPFVGPPFVNVKTSLAADIGIPLVGLVLLVTRRRWAIPTLAVGLVAVLIATVTLERVTVLMPIAMVLLFTVGLVHDRRIAIQAGLMVLMTVIGCIAILGLNSFFGPGLLAGLAWPPLAAGAGNALRTHRAAMLAAEGRAVLAEATREDEARRRVIEERLHIARELHDVIAHKIAVINVQAGVASHHLRSRPDDAAESLATVRSSAREVLDELAGLLGVLRSVGDGPDAADPQPTDQRPAQPTPTLQDIPALVDSFKRVGLQVTLESSGQPERITSAAEIAAYRTIQEALTNAHKHGDGTATLRVAHESGLLHIVVTNRLSNSPTTAPAGYGLIGMHERIRSAGGSVDAQARPNRTFVVDASFPHVKQAATR
jgi:signal transduction histidine kinase